MADRESNTANAFETTLTSDMGDTDLTANVDTTSGGPASPAYLVIDPDDDSKREIIYFDGSFTSTSFETTSLSNRYLEGSAAGSGITHNTGAKVVSVPVSQLWVDMNDRVDGHDHDGVDDTQVDHGNLLGLTDDDHTQYAKLAGDTFTGAVTFQALGTFQDGIEGILADNTHLASDAPSAWPDGLSWERISTGGWPTGAGAVHMINHGESNRTLQLFLDTSGAADTPVLYFRRRDGGTTSWGGWQTVTTAENPGIWEVDGSTEVASDTIGTSFGAIASVSLSIPSDWGSWKCYAQGSAATDATAQYEIRVVIDGTGQQVKLLSGGLEYIGAEGRRTGMTTTGSRTVSLQVRVSSGTQTLNDIFLYARAVRTS